MSSSEVKVSDPKHSDKEVHTKNTVLKDSSGWDTIGRLSTLKRNLKTLSAHTTKKPPDENKSKCIFYYNSPLIVQLYCSLTLLMT